MNSKCIILISLLLLTADGFVTRLHGQSTSQVLPSKPQIEWAEAEIGVIIHFDVVNYVPDYDFRKWGTEPPASVFKPTKLNTDQWLEAAQILEIGRAHV